MTIANLFAEDGALAAVFPGYRRRHEQVEMAEAVAAALSGGQAVLEAGTGTGKTLAYLTPILATGASALISTGTRALQDQLFQRDIPMLSEALQRSPDVAVLKGRGNYVCHLAVEENHHERLFDDDDNHYWQKIVDFTARSVDGDIRAAADIPATTAVWQQATSTRDSCAVQACRHYEKCFLYKARARARRADIVIVNHHLFLSDVRLKDEGIAEILPSRDVVLFDEAHLLPQLASQYFGDNLSTSGLIRTSRQAERIAELECGDAGPIIAAAGFLREITGALLDIAGQWSETRLSAAAALKDETWRQSAEQAKTALTDLAATLMARAGDSERVEKLAARTAGDALILKNWLSDEDAAAVPVAEDTDENGQPLQEEEEPTVRWLEYNDNRVTFSLAPLTGRTIFAKQWERSPAVIFTSATLSVSGDFRDFCEATGLDDAHTHSWQSPYDFANRALLYLPPRLPSPNQPTHTAAVVAAALPLIRANAGRAFILFSSLHAMNKAAAELHAALADDGFEIFEQGEMPNDELLNQFRRARQGVLVGSQSFWQGVDVKGEALSLVVIDKIPFAPPNDPMLLARDAWRKRRGEDAFMRNQLPPAVILTRQVAGRLIRDDDDYGVFMIGDPRIQTRGYGKVILRALPPMRRCQDGEEAAAFLRRRRPAATTEDDSVCAC